MSLRVLIVPDKFKGSLNAPAVAEMIQRGMKRVVDDLEFTTLPLTDGGEGFVEIITKATGGELGHFWTIDPLGRRCRSTFGRLDEDTAVVGLTEASGIWRIAEDERQAGIMSTQGTGRLIAWLATYQVKKVIIGLGGSCSNEGGIGLAAAFGYKFLNADGAPIPLHGFGLAELDSIVPPPSLPKAKIIAAADVENPLYGKYGASHIFAKQKGAKPKEIEQLDRNLRRLARISKKDLGHSLHKEPGAGAAGGCGYGLLNFLHGQRISGFEYFAEITKLKELIESHDLIITGEGALDDSSMSGKGPIAVAKMAKAAGKPVWAICGKCVSPSARKQFDKVGEVRKIASDQADAIKRAARHVRHVADRLATKL